MIEPHAPATPSPPPPWAVPARLPVRPATGRFLVLACVFVCAACGLVYELELVALASYLIGDSVTQASVGLSVLVFAMGIGSLVAKRLRRLAAAGFGAIEAVLALVGGSSAMALYAVFAWTGDWGGMWANGPRCLLVTFSLTIGLLIAAPRPARRAVAVLLAVELGQGTIGFVQYFTDLSEVLVGFHLLGAAVTSAAMTWALLAVVLRTPSEESVTGARDTEAMLVD